MSRGHGVWLMLSLLVVVGLATVVMAGEAEQDLQPSAAPLTEELCEAVPPPAPGTAEVVFASGPYQDPCLPECRTSAGCDAICPPCPPFNSGFCNNEIFCEAYCECFCS